MSGIAETLELSTEYRSPVNQAANAKGSIHDDATASKLGFKGGTVAGSVHMDQFVPLLLNAYGDTWLSEGNLSMYFRQATVGGEPVKALLRAAPGDRQASLWMENEGGDLINEGTASAAGADEDTELSRRVQAMEPARGLRILSDSHVGKSVKGVSVRASRESLTRRLSAITEPLAIYDDGVLPPSVATQLYRGVEAELFKRTGVVGLFGAIEHQFLNGPLRAETDYVAEAEIIALTESPKTENVWYKARIQTAADNRDAGWMIMYLRFLKASSPLWTS